MWLKIWGCNLERASQDLIGYSNTTEYADASKRVERIKKALCIKTAVI
jgi:hypothetical protein